MSTTEIHPSGAPDYAVPPGETIREYLDELGMTQRELATRLGLSAKHVNRLIQGLVPLSHEIAQRLELVTGMPAKLWNRLEADYQSAQQRLRMEQELLDAVSWLDEMPVRELVKRGIFPEEPKDKISRVQQLLAFFGVAHLTTWRDLYERPVAAFRQTKSFEASPGAVAAWLRLGELAARDVECKPFDNQGLRHALPRLRQLTSQPPDLIAPIMRDICAQYGVAVVFVREITGARASGATRWISSDKAMLLLSLRYKTDDHLWFTFFHEIAHILLHGKSDTWIEDSIPRDDPKEAEANQFSSDLLIPRKHLTKLRALKSLNSVRVFARDIGVSPGIVVGRLQYDGIWPARQGNGLKRKVELEGDF
ncbi:ImmA/IrrE family metallo-endopeptidase [Microtetraspora niveoalba]|uniref:ImmA/IrrE family metallo-endopeptidase n=1 Tax=Microtetraspora niveoalba TaxID=46175 RepID=UPI000A048C28|nr:ImmA/IrrE family metallo-endopeptidase [Microtetraspora niveoalba]